ncbi:MAG: hypothetical protein Kow0037_15750 [Calditrichia bacterium]
MVQKLYLSIVIMFFFVVLALAGNPDASFSKTHIEIPSLQLGKWAEDTIRVTNIGSITLRFQSIICSTPEVTASPDSFWILPGSFKDVAVRVFPDTAGSHSSNMVFYYENTSLTDTITIVIQNVSSPRPPQLIQASSASQFKSAVQNAVPGDVIELLDGVYDTNGSVTMHSGGTRLLPVIIRAQNRGMAELTGDSYFDLRECAYVRIEGFRFTSTDKTVIKLQASNHIRITRNWFSLTETTSRKWVLIGGIWNNPNKKSFANRIDHNLFENKTHPGNCITVDGSGDPVYQVSQFDTINYNHFRNVGPRHENEMETIRLGWSQMSMSSGYTIVEFNLFENCDGDPEIISVKSCDNIIRHNTFKNSQGTLCLRHGNRTTVEGNFFLGNGKPGCGGVRLYGDDHKIFNNYFQGLTGTKWDAPITLTNGDYDGGSSLSKHFRINRAKIAHNTLVDNDHNIEIGYTNNGSYLKPPRDVEIVNNIVVGSKNELVKIYTNPVNPTWMGNIMFPQDSAVLGISANPSQIWVTDPQLMLSDSLWQLSAGSPAIDAGQPLYSFITEDMEGQPRDGSPDVGSDEFSSFPVLYRPLNPGDVGPEAPEIYTPIQMRQISQLAKSFQLFQNYPNPFNQETVIGFSIPRSGQVVIEVFNILGQKVSRLMDSPLPAGSYQIKWNLDEFPSGTYFARMKFGDAYQTVKMVLLK